MHTRICVFWSRARMGESPQADHLKAEDKFAPPDTNSARHHCAFLNKPYVQMGVGVCRLVVRRNTLGEATGSPNPLNHEHDPGFTWRCARYAKPPGCRLREQVGTWFLLDQLLGGFPSQLIELIGA